MLKLLLYLTLFSFTFSLFFVPVVTNAQGTTFWNLERDTGVTTPNALNMYLTLSGAPQPKVFTILQNGNVGLGTTAPTAKMDIVTNGIAGLDILAVAGTAPLMNLYSDGPKGASTLAFTVLRSGNVGIGTATPNAKLDVNGNMAVSGTFSPTNLSVSGTFTAPGNGGYNINSAGTSRFADIKIKPWNTAGGSTVCMGSTAGEALGVGSLGVCSSDRRLKENIRYFQNPILPQVLKLKPALFDVINNPRKDVPGFIAQDVQEVFPEAVVDKGKDEMLQFSSEQLVPYLTKAIQELSEKVDAQQKEIEFLKQQQSK